jgi:hypothetical protein
MPGPARLNNPAIPFVTPLLTHLTFLADPDTGLGRKVTLQNIVTLLEGAAALTITDLDTSSETITLNFQNLKQRMYRSTDLITENVEIVFENEEDSLELKSWKFEVDAEGLEFTFPDNVKFVPGTAGWEMEDEHVWTAFAAGKYEISGTYDEIADEWLLKLIGNY